jgi:hypothetical protein
MERGSILDRRLSYIFSPMSEVLEDTGYCFHISRGERTIASSPNPDIR